MKGLKAEGRGLWRNHWTWVSQSPHPFSTAWLLILPLLWFTVTTEMDSFASIDYSLMEAPRATAQMLDVMFKVRVLEQGLGWFPFQCSIPTGSALSWGLLSLWLQIHPHLPGGASCVKGRAIWSGGECSHSQDPPTGLWDLEAPCSSPPSFCPSCKRSQSQLGVGGVEGLASRSRSSYTEIREFSLRDSEHEALRPKGKHL